MKKNLQNIRDQIIYDSWEKHKNRITMEELAVLFNISLKSVYRIIRNYQAIDVKFGDDTKIKVRQ